MTSSTSASRFEVLRAFLKLGAMSYGGPAIMGIMQAELQEKRAWLSKPRFVEGLALVNMLPGPGATQLGIFLGYVRAGWWGGLCAGIGFVLPAFFIMLALTVFYAWFGALPGIRRVFYGLNPVVIGIFAIAVYRLGRAAIKDAKQAAIAVASALAVGLTTFGLVLTLLLAGAVGVIVYGSRRRGLLAALIILSLYGLLRLASGWLALGAFAGFGPGGASTPHAPSLWEIALFFLKVGAFTFGGGLSMLAFVQEQVVNQLQWLTPQQFLDGLALGQLTPGPVLMLAAFVGYEVASVWGAVVAAGAIFLPSFVLMLSVLPMLERVKQLTWMKAALQGVGPAVIGMIAQAILQMLPNAVPDPLTACLALGTAGVLLVWRLSPLPLMAGGGAIGLVLRSR
ncbi:MAG TPA: chromate efflux transporter [Methylomirabilota bacterium]|nr:chromate efflux transporter [Methylomirabilota bacterium]